MCGDVVGKTNVRSSADIIKERSDLPRPRRRCNVCVRRQLKRRRRSALSLVVCTNRAKQIRTRPCDWPQSAERVCGSVWRRQDDVRCRAAKSPATISRFADPDCFYFPASPNSETHTAHTYVDLPRGAAGASSEGNCHGVAVAGGCQRRSRHRAHVTTLSLPCVVHTNPLT